MLFKFDSGYSQAASRLFGTNYNHLINKEKLAGIVLNRKMLAELAVTVNYWSLCDYQEPCSFNSLVLAVDVIEKMGLSDPVAAAKEAMHKLPDHAPVNDIQTVIDEMNKLSLFPV